MIHLYLRIDYAQRVVQLKRIDSLVNHISSVLYSARPPPSPFPLHSSSFVPFPQKQNATIRAVGRSRSAESDTRHRADSLLWCFFAWSQCFSCAKIIEEVFRDGGRPLWIKHRAQRHSVWREMGRASARLRSIRSAQTESALRRTGHNGTDARADLGRETQTFLSL